MSVRIENSLDMIGWKVVRVRTTLDGKLEVLTDKGWEEKKNGEALKYDETMIWDEEDLQELVNALGKKGIKAQSSGFAEGKLAATEAHLEDMRTLVFKKGSK